MKKIPFYVIITGLTLAFFVLVIIVDVVTTKKAGGKKHVVEIMYFNGGYGTDLVEEATRQFEAENPDVKIKSWTSQRIGDKIRLRFLANDPPEIIYPSWTVDVNRLINDGYLYGLDKELEGPAIEGNKKWKEIFYPSLLDMYKIKGKTYGIPMYFDAMLFWYNTDYFKRYNLKPPKTWEEFDNICAVLKKNNIAPIALQGRYLDYLAGVYWTVLERIAGNDFFVDACDLKPGKWNHPYQIRTARMMQDFFRKGYFQEGCLGMTHTEAQMEFMRGNAAIIWCGTWLTSEMKNVIPPNMHYSSFAVPLITGGKGDQTALMAGSQYYFICKGGKEKDLAIKFLRFMCKKSVGTYFVKKKEALMAIRAANMDTPETLKETVKTIDDARSYIFYPPPGNIYTSFNNYFITYMSDLVTRPVGSKDFKMTPEEFCKALEEKAAQVKAIEDKRNMK